MSTRCSSLFIADPFRSPDTFRIGTRVDRVADMRAASPSIARTRMPQSLLRASFVTASWFHLPSRNQSVERRPRVDEASFRDLLNREHLIFAVLLRLDRMFERPVSPSGFRHVGQTVNRTIRICALPKLMSTRTRHGLNTLGR